MDAYGGLEQQQLEKQRRQQEEEQRVEREKAEVFSLCVFFAPAGRPIDYRREIAWARGPPTVKFEVPLPSNVQNASFELVKSGKKQDRPRLYT